jgi:hypothetical protein
LIYSLFLHIQHPGHGLESSFDKGLYIIFPNFKTKAIIGLMIFIWMLFQFLAPFLLVILKMILHAHYLAISFA